MNNNFSACFDMQSNEFTFPINCQTNQKTTKNMLKIDKSCRNMSKLSSSKMWDEAKRTQLDIYVKTLFEIYRTLPNVIKILDQIIESRASNAMISNGLFSSTYDEIEKVIELSERKDKLLNLYFIADGMMKMLSEKQRKFANIKFIKKHTTETIAEELGTTKRSVYRCANSIIKQLCLKMLEKKWDSKFIAFQIGENEKWIENIFNSKLKEENSNILRKEKIKNAKSTQKELKNAPK